MKEFDVVVVGGGPAGLTAALCLGRARRSVVVFDVGNPRHAVARGVHNFLTRENMPPGDLRRIAWEQVAAYPSVLGPVRRRVRSAQRDGSTFVVEADDGEVYRTRALLIATGVQDQHPDIAGYAERWGHSIHPCPYCHGWEIREQPVAVLGDGASVGYMAPLLRAWTDDVVALTNGAQVHADVRAELERRHIPLHEQRIVRLHGPDHTLAAVEFDDGTSLARSALFSLTPQRQVPFVRSLELQLDESGYVEVDSMMQTSREGVWAAGDSTSHLQQVVEAAAQGMRAGACINATLTLG